MDIEPRGDPLPDLGDEGLMARIRDGEEEALTALIRRYWEPLVQYGFGFVNRTDAAEDIAQEAFVRLWQGREGWEETGSVRGYLYTIVRNLCLHERDRRKIREARAQDEELRTPEFSPTPSQVFDQQEVLRTLNETISRLPERRREVFTLACLHGLSYREVADAMGVAVPTVANQMSAALNELREALRSVSDERI